MRIELPPHSFTKEKTLVCIPICRIGFLVWGKYFSVLVLKVPGLQHKRPSVMLRLVLVQCQIQFGPGILFRHIERNTTALSCCGPNISFAMFHTLDHKLLSCRSSYRKYCEGRYCGNVQVTPKYYLYGPRCCMKADKHEKIPIAILQKMGWSRTVDPSPIDNVLFWVN